MNHLLNLLTTLANVFTGAWAAFRYQEFRQINEVVDKNIAASNRALYTLFNLWNIQRQYQKEVIEPERGKPDVWLNMSATLTYSFGLTAFQANELSFLLQTPHAQIYADLMLEEQRFQGAMNMIELRSGILLNQVSPRLSAAGVVVGTPLPEPDLNTLLGIDIVHKLKGITEGIIGNIDENVISLKAVHDNLRSAFEALYPDREIVEIRFDEEPVAK